MGQQTEGLLRTGRGSEERSVPGGKLCVLDADRGMEHITRCREKGVFGCNWVCVAKADLLDFQATEFRLQ